MEESEKRRERLKAMRVEAEASEIADDSTGHLSNPLIEPSANPLVDGSSPAAQRFDFYTDPMAAFSANKRRSSSMQTPQNYTSSGSPIDRFPSSPSGPRNFVGGPSPTHQYHSNYSPNNCTPDRRTYEASLGFGGSDSWRSPVGIASHLPGHQGNPPIPWNRSGGRGGYSFPSHSPRGVGFSSPRSPGLGWGSSPSPSSGRGNRHQFGNSRSPGSGRGGGRGHGFQAVVSAHERPDMFYNKTMVEDPWKFLTPVVRSLGVEVNAQRTPDSLRSWLPKSVALKRARVSEAVDVSNSQSSLADCLSSAFEEAVDDARSI